MKLKNLILCVLFVNTIMSVNCNIIDLFTQKDNNNDLLFSQLKDLGYPLSDSLKEKITKTPLYKDVEFSEDEQHIKFKHDYNEKNELSTDFYVYKESEEDFEGSGRGRSYSLKITKNKIEKIQFQHFQTLNVCNDDECFDSLYPIVDLSINYDKNGNLSKIKGIKSISNIEDPSIDSCYIEVLLNNSENSISGVKSISFCDFNIPKFLPYRPIGDYFISGNNVRVRNNSSLKSDVIRTLKNNEIVSVMQDTRKLELISGSLSTWVKVILSDGSQGFIFGNYLRAPLEPDLINILDRLNDQIDKAQNNN